MPPLEVLRGAANPASTSIVIDLVLVAGEPVVLDGLMWGFAQEAAIDVVGVGDSVATARHLIDRFEPDVVLTDLRLRDGLAFELLLNRVADPRPAVVILSAFMPSQHVKAAIALGAAGYVEMTSRPFEIAAAAVAAAEGRRAFTNVQLRDSVEEPWRPLSVRDRALLVGLMAGSSNDELGTELHVSRKAVEARLSRLFTAFGVTTRTELAVLAERDRLIDLPVATVQVRLTGADRARARPPRLRRRTAA
jgi:DNA-binding NarL/FixJ family response regulator